MDERARRNRERILSVEAPETLARLQAIPSYEPARPRFQRETTLSVAWFPAPEWELAVERWPDLLEDLPREHRAYSHEIEARVKRIARAIPGQPLHVSPLTVDALIAHATLEDQDPGTAEARASYAAEVVRTGVARVAARTKRPVLVRVRSQVQAMLWLDTRGAGRMNGSSIQRRVRWVDSIISATHAGGFADSPSAIPTMVVGDGPARDAIAARDVPGHEHWAPHFDW